MASIGPFMGQMGGMGGGAAPAQGGAGGKAVAAEAAPKAIEKEKTHYDVELSAFEASGKIKIIKEVRSMLGLGLKEAKEMVESSPCWIKKELVKADADDLKTKLEALGASVRLV
jgi:large subunit ribosomal protein L7/L12